MAIKQLYFKDVIADGALMIQDGGTPPVSAPMITGWTVAKNGPGFAKMVVGAEAASGLFTTGDALASPVFGIGSCWRSESPFLGQFANTDWTFVFKMRARTASGGQQGRVKVRLWRSASPVGAGAVQLAAAILSGSITSALTMSAVTSAITWSPGDVKPFVDEYLFVQCEWEITTASGNVNADVVFAADPAVSITTPDFSLLPQRLDPEFFPSADEVEQVHDCAMEAGVSEHPNQFPTVGFISRWTDAEYSLFRTRMRGIVFMGPALSKKWDIALATGVIDITDVMLPAFKEQLIVQNVLSRERADIIFEGIVAPPAKQRKPA